MTNLAAWVLQVLLAAFFVFHGVMYLLAPERMVSDMRAKGQWPPAIPDRLRRFIGAAEICGAIGLLLPAATRLLPWLTPLAALGLATVTLCAVVYHLRRREPPVPILFAVLAIVVLYLRWQVAPIGAS